MDCDGRNLNALGTCNVHHDIFSTSPNSFSITAIFAQRTQWPQSDGQDRDLLVHGNKNDYLTYVHLQAMLASKNMVQKSRFT